MQGNCQPYLQAHLPFWPPLLIWALLQNMGGSAGSPTNSGYWGSSGNLIQQNLDAQALLAQQQQALNMLQGSSGLDRQVRCLQGPCWLQSALPACQKPCCSIACFVLGCPLILATGCSLTASAE